MKNLEILCSISILWPMAVQLSRRRMEGKRVAVVTLYSSRLDCAIVGECGKICLASICGTAAITAAVACVRGCTKNWSVHVRLMMPCGKASITHSSSKISCSTVIRNNSKPRIIIIVQWRPGAGSEGPLSSCTMIKKLEKVKPTKRSVVRDAALNHLKYIRGSTRYPLERNAGGSYLCMINDR
uniref:Uncharacterized protein n=1 Tax=Oryza glumipatula TaxID=40148 RepID=A0A0D9YLE4_9ORYZ